MAADNIDQGRRRFLVGITTLFGGIGAAFAAVPFISSWRPSRKAKAAGAPVSVNIGKLQPGERLTVEWRGKPVWVIRRGEETVQQLTDAKYHPLRDPASKIKQQPDYAQNTYRSVKPEYLVLVGICTHLGCSPTFVPGIGELGSDWPGGFYCPCHGSKFDLAGRVFTGVPAPINLEVPPYRFVEEDVILIGEDTEIA